MRELRPVELPEKDLPLRADISLLGSLVGKVLVEQHGEDLLKAVEAIRKSSIRAREETGQPDDQLTKLLSRLGPGQAGLVIHAFSAYLRMANLAENVHRIRRRRAYQVVGAEPQRGSLDAVIGSLLEVGVDAGALNDALSGLMIRPVFTAHPTEATRRTIQEKEYDVVLRLVERFNPDRTAEEEEVTHQRLRSAISSAWQTRLVPHVRPTVADELDNILFYVTDILYRVVPVFFESLDGALDRHGVSPQNGRATWIRSLLRFGSWVGGDMDGNPNVDASTIRGTLLTQRHLIIGRYIGEAREIGRYLSQSESEISFSRAVLDRLDHYREAMPHVASGIPERHSDMPYRCMLRFIVARLGSTLEEGKHAYGQVAEFLDDLRAIERSLLDNRGRHAGWFQLQRYITRVEVFGFHMLTLDVRQDSLLHRRVMGEWLNDPGWLERSDKERTQRLVEILSSKEMPPLPDENARSADMNRTLDVFEAIAESRQRYGSDAIGLFIISMTQGADDVLTVIALSRLAGSAGESQSPLWIAPLLETVGDLDAGSGILNSLFSLELYRQHLDATGNRQVVMVGYSDSNKDGGIVASRWALQKAQRTLTRLGQDAGVNVVFFHGRGGTVSRGGGNLVNGILGAPPCSVNGFMRVTEQGEVINRKYGVRPIALRNLELVTGAALTHTLGCERDVHVSAKDEAQRDRILESMARTAKHHYRSLVYGDERFPGFFRTFTPVDVIERLNIGSRPASRRSGAGIENLRAIPWVFSWAQVRIGFPGVYGIGHALHSAASEFGMAALRRLYNEWRFFRAMIDDVEMVLGKSEIEIGRAYLALVSEESLDIFGHIEAEFLRAKDIVLELKQSERLLDDQGVLQRSIWLRNPYVDPLHLLQIDLLRQWRACGREDDGLLKNLKATVNGIALGIRNTG